MSLEFCSEYFCGPKRIHNRMSPIENNRLPGPLSDDTSYEVEMIIVEGMRNWTPAQRIRRVSQLNDMVRSLVIVDIREKRPNADEREVRLRMASRYISRELMIRAFGWDPDEGNFGG